MTPQALGQGSALLDVMTVMAIIGLLMTVAVPIVMIAGFLWSWLNGFRERAGQASDEGDLTEYADELVIAPETARSHLIAHRHRAFACRNSLHAKHRFEQSPDWNVPPLPRRRSRRF